MTLTTKELLSVLRNSVDVKVMGSTEDPQFLQMSDEDLKLYLKLGVSRAYPNEEDLGDLPEGAAYPIILLSKIELYTKLAVARADKVNMSAGDGVSISLAQRFEHYMKLVEEARNQYESWLKSDGVNGGLGVSSYDVLLSKRHYSNRNYEKQLTPRVSLKVDIITKDSVSFHWGVSNTSHFGAYNVYFGSRPIFDRFKVGEGYNSKISAEAELILTTGDIRNNAFTLNNLQPEKTYYILVVALERNQVYGVKEISFTTLGV